MKLLRTAVLLACAAWPAVTSTAAGPSSGSLRGAVRSRTGERLANVVVRAASEVLQSTRVVATGPAGGFLLRGLPPGRYTVSFERDGFATHEQRTTIRAGIDARLDVTLRPSDFDTTIVVTGELTEAADRAALGLVLGRDQLDRLPLGRSLDRVASLSPNLTSASASLTAVDRPRRPLVVAGAEGGTHLRLVDGADTSDPLEGGGADLYVPEAVLEVITWSSAVPAEYGRFAGGVASAVTARGGRSLHGSLRLRLTNPAWRDETPFEIAEGVSREDRTGTTLEAGLGGAVRADDLWFFLAGLEADSSSQETLRLIRDPYRHRLEDRRYQAKLSGAIGESHALVGGHAESDRDEHGPAHPAGSTLETLLQSRTRRELTHLRYTGVLGPRLFVEGSSARTRGEAATRGAADLLAGTPFLCLGPEPECQYGAPLADSTDPGRFQGDETTASLGLFVDSRGAGSHDLSLGVGRLEGSSRGGRSRSPTDAVIVRDPALEGGGLVPRWISPADGVDRGYAVFQADNRGFATERVTEFGFVSDSWRPDEHWTLDLGLRSERVTLEREPGLVRLAFDSWVPRLGAAFDVAADGRYVLRTTYAEYSDSGAGATAWLRDPDTLLGTYVGPSGSGLAFAPGRDPDNYRTVGARAPGGNVSVAPGAGLGEIAEWMLSSTMQLGYGGHIRLSYVDRRWQDRLAETIVPGNGTSIAADGTVVDNVVLRASPLLGRSYAAVVLEGRLPPAPAGRWSFDGHWTHQLENEGAGGGAAPAAYPEIHDVRNAPVGPLPDFQRDRLRLWTTFRRTLPRGGAVNASLLFSYDSARRYSLAERIPLTSVQRAILRSSGYAGEPVAPLLFYGAANDQEFSSAHTLDFSVRYGVPAGRVVEPWLQVEILNVLGEDALVAWDTAVVGDPAGPVDALGRPTSFTRGEAFGSARDSRDHVAPRELRVSLGLRF